MTNLTAHVTFVSKDPIGKELDYKSAGGFHFKEADETAPSLSIDFVSVKESQMVTDTGHTEFTFFLWEFDESYFQEMNGETAVFDFSRLSSLKLEEAYYEAAVEEGGGEKEIICELSHLSFQYEENGTVHEHTLSKKQLHDYAQEKGV